MFTIKLYSDDGARQKILSAESFTILRGGDEGGAEITLHQKNGNDDIRIDIRPVGTLSENIYYQRAIIENAAGRTTEILSVHMLPPARKAA